MITTDDVLNMNFYKKEKFTGSYKGMRYLLKKDTEEERTVFRCYIWPGPYNFASTPDEQKTMAVFDFTEEGKQEAVDWMNGQWMARDNWT